MSIEKLRPSFTFTEDRLREMQAIVPEAFADGKINWDKLREALGEHLEEEGQEHFGLSWPGKREARRLAAMPSKGTLVPQPGQGMNEEATHNIFVEGDNLEVLKLLQKSYSGQIKMIYFDPPYNTGNDFIYSDNFTDPIEDYLRKTGAIGDNNILLTTNSRTDGRFHSNWLNMIYPRLRLARNLLREDGIIFISIDDNEYHHLKILMNEIFGDENFVETLVWKRRATAPNDRIIGKNHEYILVYCKSQDFLKLFLQPRTEEALSAYKNPDNDVRGPWRASDLSANGKGGRLVQSCIFPIKNPVSGEEFLPPENKCWLYNSGKISTMLAEGRIGFREKSGYPFLKRYLSEVRQGVTQPTIIDDGGFSQDSAKEIRDLFNADVFEFPKPVKLIKKLITIGSAEDDIILDIAAGSCTLAQAVIEMNIDQNTSRKFICIQLPEPTNSDSVAYKAGFHFISSIGKERIRRVINKTQTKLPSGKDVGFSCFKLQASHFKEWQIHTEEDISQLQMLFSNASDPLKDGWKTINVKTEVLLIQGFPLDSKTISLPDYQENNVQEVSHNLCGHKLYLCLDEKISQVTVDAISIRSEDIFVCLDSAISDEDKIRLSDRCNLKVI